MRIQDLKKEARKLWVWVTCEGTAFADQPGESFEKATERYKLDRRRHDSWVTIYADLFAKWLYETWDDPALLLQLISQPPLPVGRAVLDQFLMFNDGYQMIVDALSTVYPNLNRSTPDVIPAVLEATR